MKEIAANAALPALEIAAFIAVVATVYFFARAIWLSVRRRRRK